MNEMQEWEASTLLEYIEYTDRRKLEMDRYNMYILAQANSRKKLKPTDIMKFVWDDEDHAAQHKTTISNEEKKMLQEMANIIKDKLT